VVGACSVVVLLVDGGLRRVEGCGLGLWQFFVPHVLQGCNIFPK